jgi:predicted acetyltransferase
MQDIPALERELDIRYRAELTEGFFGEIVRGQAAKSAADPDRYLWHTFWLMVRKADRVAVGSMDFKCPPENGAVELGYGQMPEFFHQGYMTEGVRAFCAWALTQPGVERITADTAPDNPASQRVLARCGFLPCGPARFEGGESDFPWFVLEKPGLPVPAVDRTSAKRAFAAYVTGYNAKDPKVALKIAHTYRVAALCERLARSIGMPEDACGMAWLCGLLHDIGRFEQLRRYGTFNDAKSIDHAACSAEALFVQGHIREYLADPAWDSLLETAVRTHSAYRLPRGLDARTLQFCNLLRDADKIDILRVNVEVPLEDIYNVTTEALRTCSVSDETMQHFSVHHAVPRTAKHTPADNVVGHASLVFELTFPESWRIVREQGWLTKLLDFSSRNPDTLRCFARIRREVEIFLDAKCR